MIQLMEIQRRGHITRSKLHMNATSALVSKFHMDVGYNYQTHIKVVGHQQLMEMVHEE